MSAVDFENVAVSTRVRLARNFSDYPFPNRLKSEESALEIVDLLSAQLKDVEDFKLHYMDTLEPEKAEFLKERNLISQALIDNKKYSAVLISSDRKISIMINEEDHIREQYFMGGFDLNHAYERISGIDDIISETIPFAYDKTLGYLTACPTNLGTGLRASVMLFLPALAQTDGMKAVVRDLKNAGLTARGAFGEGSSAEGHLFQISNEVTLGVSELKLLQAVEKAVCIVSAKELSERERLVEREGYTAFTDRILRAYGVLSNCFTIDFSQFMQLLADVKLGVAMGILDGSLQQLDVLLTEMRPANIDRMNGSPLSGAEKDLYRAEYVGRALHGMELLTESKRSKLSSER